MRELKWEKKSTKKINKKGKFLYRYFTGLFYPLDAMFARDAVLQFLVNKKLKDVESVLLVTFYNSCCIFSQVTTNKKTMQPSQGLNAPTGGFGKSQIRMSGKSISKKKMKLNRNPRLAMKSSRLRKARKTGLNFNVAIRRLLPKHRITKDAREVISQLLTSYLNKTAIAARTIIRHTGKKTLSVSMIDAAISLDSRIEFQQHARCAGAQALEVLIRNKRNKTK